MSERSERTIRPGGAPNSATGRNNAANSATGRNNAADSDTGRSGAAA